MTFNLLWIDYWFAEQLFGFGFFTFKQEESIRSLIAIYWNDGELLFDLFWIRLKGK